MSAASREPEDSSAAATATPVVRVVGLVNRFGSQVVHDGLSMEVRPHEIFGIVGGSGTGKSVLLRTILGLREPQAGTVEVFGRDIRQLGPEERLATNGAMPPSAVERRETSSDRVRAAGPAEV